MVGTFKMRRRFSTLSDGEKQDREDQSLIKPAPKKKPPRKDRKKTRVDDTSADSDSDSEQDKKDRSQNYKDARVSNVLDLFLKKSAITKVLGKGNLITVRNKETDKVTQVTEETLKRDKSKYKKVDPKELETEKEETPTEDGSGTDTDDGSESSETKTEEKPVKPPTATELKDRFPDVDNDTILEVMDSYEGQDLTDYLESEQNNANKEKQRKKEKVKQEKQKKTKQLQDQAQKLKDERALREKEDAVRKRNTPTEGDVAAKAKKDGLEMFENYKDADLENISSQVKGMQSYVAELTRDENADKADVAGAMAQLGALRLLESVKQGEEATGLGSAMSVMVNQAMANGDKDLIANFITADMFAGGAASAETQKAYRDTLDSIGMDDLGHILPDDHPIKDLANSIASMSDSGAARFLTEEDKVEVGEWIKDMLQAEASFLDPVVTNGGGTLGENNSMSADLLGDIVDSDMLDEAEDRVQFKIQTKGMVTKAINTMTSLWRDVNDEPITSNAEYAAELKRRIEKMQKEQEGKLDELKREQEQRQNESETSSDSGTETESGKKALLIRKVAIMSLSRQHINSGNPMRNMSTRKKQADNLVNYQERAKSFSVGDIVTMFGRRKDMSGRVTAVYAGIGMVDVEFSRGNMRVPVEELQQYDQNGDVNPPHTVTGRVAMTRRVALYWADKNRQYRMNKNEIGSGKAYCPKCGVEHVLRPTNYKMRDGVRERLLGCGNCLFLVKELDILNSKSHTTKGE